MIAVYGFAEINPETNSMASIKLLLAPIRRVLAFPLVQLAITVGVILWLQSASDNSAAGQIYNALDQLVDVSVRRCAAIFDIKSFTRSWLGTGLWIAYVYLAGLVILYVAKLIVMAVVELVARHNVFYLRSAIARERGIEAYRAWLPLERIRPAHIPQDKWEEAFAWPADNRPPYPSLTHRIVRDAASYVVAFIVVVVLLQEFTPFPVLTWLSSLGRKVVVGG
jgi:hypothetical protein